MIERIEEVRLVIASTWDGLPLPEREQVRVVICGDGRIEVDAPFYGDPRPEGEGWHERLWEHEVVEVFFAAAPSREAPYFELELGPHGHWLALGFARYRERLAGGERAPFEQGVQHEAVLGADGRWRGTARVPAAWVALPWVNAYAIHGSGPARRYAAAFPAPTGRYAGPDFHRVEHFGRLR